MCCSADWKREVVQDHKVGQDIPLAARDDDRNDARQGGGERRTKRWSLSQWDFINVAEFRKTDFFTRLKWVLPSWFSEFVFECWGLILLRYIWRYILLFKSLAVYGLDIFTAVTMVSSSHVSSIIPCDLKVTIADCIVDERSDFKRSRRNYNSSPICNCKMGILWMYHLFFFTSELPPPARLFLRKAIKAHQL